MQNDIYPNSESNYNQQIPLQNLFRQKQIVQSYHTTSNQIIFYPKQKKRNVKYHPADLIIQHPMIDDNSLKHNRFMEDDIFEELHSGHIVENFQMLDQKEQGYGGGQNPLQIPNKKASYINQNMLASSSQNNDVPSRNSSLSSLSEKNHLINIKTKRNFLDEHIEDLNICQNQRKSSLLLNRKYSKHIQGNSQNQMDRQNSPFQPESPLEYHLKNNHRRNHHSFFIPKIIQNSIGLTRNITPIPSQNKSLISTFRRMDIDEERQRREKLLKIQKIQQMGCNCRKSKCLKMYCQCFNLQIFCNENCNCVACCNQQSNQQHKKAVLDALTRNPKAFNETKQKIDATFQLGVQLTEVRKGCKCKKTKCQKKYCECYNVGDKCGKFCKCEGCQNC